MIAITGTTSKILHPPEDISLEELRSRKSKYNKKKVSTNQTSGQQQPLHQQQSHNITTTIAQIVQTSTTSMASHAHEVCIKFIFLFLL